MEYHKIGNREEKLVFKKKSHFMINNERMKRILESQINLIIILYLLAPLLHPR